jgi:hypothetical protein
MVLHTLEQTFSAFFNSRYTEQGAEIVKAHHQFLREILSLKTSNEIMFKIPIAKILIIVLFLKIMLIMDFYDSLFLDIFLFFFFELPLNSGTKPADPWRHTSVPRYRG